MLQKLLDQIVTQWHSFWIRLEENNTGKKEIPNTTDKTDTYSELIDALTL